jgi:hypothetical protein
MREAVDEIVKCLTAEDLKGKLVVILAGYETQIAHMLAVNPGLQSRFARKIRFHNLTAAHVSELFLCKLQDRFSEIMTPGARAQLPRLCQHLTRTQGFSNGRDVETWARKVTRKAAGSNAAAIDDRMLHETLMDLVSERESNAHAAHAATSAPRTQPTPQAQDSASARPPPAAVTAAAPPTIDRQPAQPPPAATATAAASGPAVNVVKGQSLFSDLPSDQLRHLQTVLDSFGLSSEAGTHALCAGGIDGPMGAALMHALQQQCSMHPAIARQLLERWIEAQRQLEEQVQEARRRRLRPIWRCGVCGRADKPFIACYVAPYIVRLEAVDE